MIVRTIIVFTYSLSNHDHAHAQGMFEGLKVFVNDRNVDVKSILNMSGSQHKISRQPGLVRGELVGWARVRRKKPLLITKDAFHLVSSI